LVVLYGQFMMHGQRNIKLDEANISFFTFFAKALKYHLMSFKLSNIWSPSEMHATYVIDALTTQTISLSRTTFNCRVKWLVT